MVAECASKPLISQEMPAFSDKLKNLRLERRLNQDELAHMAGMAVSAIGKLERGASRPALKTLRKLAKALDVPIDTLDPNPADFDENVSPYTEHDVRAGVPTFDLTVAAGHWVDVSEAGQLYDNHQIDHGYFRVRIRGDSMEPDYRDGEVVEFRCMRVDKEGPMEGRDYYVQRADGCATFKRLEVIEEDAYQLRPLNRKKYPKLMPVERGLVVRMAVAVFVGRSV